MYHVSIVYPDNTQEIIICIPRYLMKKKCRSTFFYRTLNKFVSPIIFVSVFIIAMFLVYQKFIHSYSKQFPKIRLINFFQTKQKLFVNGCRKQDHLIDGQKNKCRRLFMKLQAKHIMVSNQEQKGGVNTILLIMRVVMKEN